MKKDVLDKKPQWMTLSCGVNDVWHGPRGVTLEDYKKNITKIVDDCTKAGVKVMILTATMIGEEPEIENNKKLAPYNDFLRELARERKLPLADLNAQMQEAVAKFPTPEKGKKRTLTGDGVHMRAGGNVMMATGVLKAFGLTDEQMKKAKDNWADIQTEYRPRMLIPLKVLLQIEQLTPDAQKEVQLGIIKLLEEQAAKKSAAPEGK